MQFPLRAESLSRVGEGRLMQLSPLIAIGSTKVVTLPHISVRHGCSTRLGGLSKPPFDSLNMGFSVADAPQAVWENRRRFAVLLGVDSLPSLLSMSHGKEVAVVDEPPAQPNDFTRSFPAVYGADAAITRLSGVPLTLTVADCVPVFFTIRRQAVLALLMRDGGGR